MSRDKHVAAQDQRFTERGAECCRTHVQGYTGPMCSCGAGLCLATRDESENQRFNPAPSAATASLRRGNGPLSQYGCECPWEENDDGSATTYHSDECPFVRSHRVNWAGVLVLDPIPDLDPGIAPWVEILRAHRIETFESCQGGPDLERPDRGHAYPEPTIAFQGGPSAGVHAYHVARQHGLPVSAVRRVWKEVDHELTGPVWEIVFTRKATAQESVDGAAVLAFERGES